MVKARDRFLIDTAFLIERTHKTFFGTPLLMVGGRDHTFTYGFARDLLRLRRKLGIKSGVLVIGKDTRSLTSNHNIEDVLRFLEDIKIPHVHDPQNITLQIVRSLCSRFSHIVTGDKRLLQLSGDDLTVVLAQEGGRTQINCMSREAIKTEMGVAPADVPTYLTLTEGLEASRLTKKQAARLIELYGNLDSIYENLSKMTSPQIRNRLADNEDQARQYYAESKIERTSEPARYETESPSANLDTESNRQLLGIYGFHSLLVQLAEPPDVRLEWNGSKPKPDSYHAVVNRAGLKELESLISSAEACSIDTESDDRDPRKATLFGVSFSVRVGEAHFVPLIENDLQDVSKDDVLKVLRRIFNSDVDIIGHNIKYDYLLLRRNGIRMKSIHFDTMLAAYDCHGDWDFFNLGHLSQKLLGKRIRSYSEVVGPNRTFLDLPLKEMVNHACQDADMTLRLYPALMDELNEKGIAAQYFENTMRVLKRLGELESRGIPANERKIHQIRDFLLERAVRMKECVCKQLGRDFDLDSQKDLSAVVKEAMDFRRFIGSRTITLSVLEQLAISEPIVRQIVQYKRCRKQIMAVESISAAMNGKRIYPLFNQIRSRAGLVVTTKPSLFDIAALAELRSCFDNSIHEYFKDQQRSLDILAHVTQDPVLKRVRASRSKVDAFVANHSLMKDVDHDEFLLSCSIGYSDSALSRVFLLDQLTISRIRHDLEKRYRSLFRWLERYQMKAKTKGYATTDGKRKYLDGLRSSNIAKRRQALEYAVRWLIQL